ncbi:MAG: hypothetical protein IT446_10770 [Phycisphaerales bacterium]|nr:hypothetical protein [Phycisphaerales bacterium]
MANRIARIVSTGVFRDVVAPKHRTLFLPRSGATVAHRRRREIRRQARGRLSRLHPAHKLYGVDLSREAVEITQLAL